MSRIPTVKAPSPHAQELLGAVQKKLGMVPNMMSTMANSPAVLESYLAFSGALNHSSLPPALREQIALAVSEANACDYCLAAHGKFGILFGLNAQQMALARQGKSSNPKEQAAITFAKTLVEKLGKVSDQDVEEVRQAGYDNGAITEIVAVVSLNVFTNYFNHVADPEIDFPKAQ